jgi:hypothetical protein
LNPVACREPSLGPRGRTLLAVSCPAHAGEKISNDVADKKRGSAGASFVLSFDEPDQDCQALGNGFFHPGSVGGAQLDSDLLEEFGIRERRCGLVVETGAPVTAQRHLPVP